MAKGSEPSGTASDADDGAVDVPRPIRVAAVILGIEALGLVAAAAFLVYAVITGHHFQITRSLLGAGMALLGAWALVAGARALLRLSVAARSPMVVIQVLALPVSYSLAIQAGKVAWGGPILVAAVATIYLLFTPPAREALDRHIERD